MIEGVPRGFNELRRDPPSKNNETNKRVSNVKIIFVWGSWDGAKNPLNSSPLAAHQEVLVSALFWFSPTVCKEVIKSSVYRTIYFKGNSTISSPVSLNARDLLNFLFHVGYFSIATFNCSTWKKITWTYYCKIIWLTELDEREHSPGALLNKSK